MANAALGETEPPCNYGVEDASDRRVVKQGVEPVGVPLDLATEVR